MSTACPDCGARERERESDIVAQSRGSEITMHSKPSTRRRIHRQTDIHHGDTETRRREAGGGGGEGRSVHRKKNKKPTLRMLGVKNTYSIFLKTELDQASKSSPNHPKK